jgi:hypothetical protein
MGRDEELALEQQIASRQAKGIAERLGPEAPAIGMNPDGTLNIVQEDDPPFMPRILAADAFDDDFSDIASTSPFLFRITAPGTPPFGNSHQFFT